MYHEIKKMKEEGFTISKIGRRTSLDRRTVRKYLSMTEPGFDKFLENQSERKRDLLPYESFVKSKLVKYPDTSSAQMHDWLKESYPDFPLKSAKTIFNFVSWLRIKYHIPKISPTREYEIVDVLPYGQQAQVDFGEYTMRTSNGSKVKVHFFTLVLSRSRYKYIWFTDKYFTSDLAVEAHEKAFAYIGGIPEEIVYDQDKVFITSENNGDIILTSGFRAYTRERSFKLYFCRKSDPESKGKVENVVKYVKQNFLYNRTYTDVDMLNSAVMAWLSRTGNNAVHNRTKKQPFAEWEIERPTLGQYIPCIHKPKPETVTIRKDNTICWKSNVYSVPLGTYKGRGSEALINIDGNYLILSNGESIEICRHLVSAGKGNTVKNPDHGRDKKPGIDKLIEQVCNMFDNPLRARQFLNAIREAKPRYIRDQLLIIKVVIERSDKHVVELALDYCYNQKITSATDFKAVAESYMKSTSLPAETKIISMNPLSGTVPPAALIRPAQSSIESYQTIIKSNSHDQ